MADYKIEHIDTKRWGIGNYPCRSAQDGSRLLVCAGDNGGGYVLRTEDGGETWSQFRDSRRRGDFKRLADGSYITFGFHSAVEKCIDPEIQDKIPYILEIGRAGNYDAVAEGNIQREFTPVDIPDLAVGYGDSGDKSNYSTGAMASGIIQLENGDIIVSMYGQFKSDKSKLDYFTNYDFYQYRTWCIISHDNGKTFEYLSTVADCGTYPVPEAEGYCESDLLYLGDGHILCAMRTQGHEVYTPMFFSHSYDSGKTWSKPEQLNPYGVLPRLIRMDCGAVVCASGKWDTFFLLSGDGGKSWSKPYVIAENDGQWDRGPSGYVTVAQIEPDILTVVYDTTEDKVSDDIVPGERRIVYISRYRISKAD